jgi:hypothetical protein
VRRQPPDGGSEQQQRNASHCRANGVDARRVDPAAVPLQPGLRFLDNVIRCRGVVATKYPRVGNGIDFIDMFQMTD